MRIGIDFDNTLVCYDTVFHKAACMRGLIPSDLPSSKGAVRDYLRSIGQEEAWTELQGTVYGSRMDLAEPYPGARAFLQLCQERSIPLFIISHKTLFPFRGPQYNLHQAATAWLSSQQWSDIPAYFELTLADKLARIASLGCTLFIDDLPELLEEPNFPSHVEKILFDPNHLSKEGSYTRVSSWSTLTTRFL